MSENNMPAAEAAVADVQDSEQHSYEFAFHVLPTVAEGEVTNVFENIKAQITKDGGVITSEEAPERLDLAYDIVKQIEGKNRKFHSAYFGWVRFTAEGAILETLDEELTGMPEILRSLMLKLNKFEEQNPFRYHEAHKASKVTTIDDGETIAAEEDAPVADAEEVPAVEEDAVEEKA